MTSEIVTYLQKDEVKTRFAEILGDHEAASYIASVLIAVANSDALQKCTAGSIYISALRAATLRLSVDPILGQAYLVPFSGKATLMIGYKGLYDLAMKTGKYRYINIDKVYEGEEIVFDRITGAAHLAGEKKSDTLAGIVGAFELVAGFSKVIYMSVDEIEFHAKKYSKSYNLDNSLWKTEHYKMQKKTVLRILLSKWGYFDPREATILSEIEAESENENETIEGVTTPTVELPANLQTVPEEPRMSTEQAITDLGF